MSFVDKVTVSIAAGNGGDGHLSFRHEKFVDKGGPDGGDGGNGGNVVALATRNENTLAAFRYQKEIRAQSGAPGGKQRKHGKSAEALLVPLPVGTVITNEAGDVVADLTEDGQQVVIAQGGKGGFGNAHFTSSTRQAPRIVEKGEPGEVFAATLELKSIADVGLVGLPNAGKSTLLSVVSNARPEIANYPFTTLTPNLGIVDVDKKTSLLLADIPGLIEGAATGKGLGDEFLRHVERSGVLLHLIDAYQDNMAEAYETIQNELKAYKIDLSKRPQIVVITKIEGLDAELVSDIMKQLKKVVPARTLIMAISAQAKTGLTELVRKTAELVARETAKEAKRKEIEPEIPVIRLEQTDDAWHVEKTDNGWLVTGKKIERFAARTDFTNEASAQRLRDIMKRMGILHELKRRDAQPQDKIIIQGNTLEL